MFSLVAYELYRRDIFSDTDFWTATPEMVQQKSWDYYSTNHATKMIASNPTY